MKLLLINPKFPESFWSFEWAHQNITPEVKTLNSPLGLATLAALTPSDWEIEIVDENVEAIDWMATADIVGVCGMGVQAPRQKEILRHFKSKGCFVVAGGSYASLCPEEYTGLADAVISGESEYIWPQFCQDYLAGNPKALYQETGTVNLHDSPCPRFDLLKLELYQRVSLQFSRGCPFLCEFCDIIIMFGRTPRNKTTAQIEKELDCLREQGVRGVFFVDDNFIGNKKLAKDLLAFLEEYQIRHNYRFNFGTEASVNLADDEALLNGMRRANFEWVFMGIESPSEASLLETKKVQNAKGDLLEKIRKIYASGLDVMAGFIVGFDSDDATIFERQRRFIEASGIVISMAGVLVALPKTPLYKRLQASGRLIDENNGDQTRAFTNIVPLQMSSQELIDGFVSLHRSLSHNGSVYRRLANKFKYLREPSPYSPWDLKTKLRYLMKFLFRGVLAGGPSRIYYFSRSLLLGLRRPKVLALIISDWVAAISLQSFVHRRLEKPSRLGEWAQWNFQKLQQEISLKISEWQGTEKVWIELKDKLDPRLLKSLFKSIRGYVKRCQGSIVLDLHELREQGIAQLRPLLSRLGNYGAQIQIHLTPNAYQSLSPELKPFQFCLV
ncbi:MAG TPA: B12-binding domain-containing radical SAM protein [Deltaproteobacteria bacterium]|nr:B12-binding domain-containing radical SAM protein [Deltaproteobacteria bacterium]